MHYITLKHHIKTRSLIHTIKQLKNNNKCIFLTKNLQLIENIDLFQKVKEIYMHVNGSHNTIHGVSWGVGGWGGGS